VRPVAQVEARQALDGLVDALVARGARISPEQRERRRRWIQEQRLSDSEALYIPPDFDPED
jgi:hypothetical protein